VAVLAVAAAAEVGGQLVVAAVDRDIVVRPVEPCDQSVGKKQAVHQ